MNSLFSWETLGPKWFCFVLFLQDQLMTDNLAFIKMLEERVVRGDVCLYSNMVLVLTLIFSSCVLALLAASRNGICLIAAHHHCGQPTKGQMS